MSRLFPVRARNAWNLRVLYHFVYLCICIRIFTQTQTKTRTHTHAHIHIYAQTDRETNAITRTHTAHYSCAHNRTAVCVCAQTHSHKSTSRDKEREIKERKENYIKCEEPKCACNVSLKEKPCSYPVLAGQVRLRGDTQYVRALGKIFEAGEQPVKNRERRSLTQKGNQVKFFHRMPGIQRSPAVYNLQHLREYNSCRIWASQSRRRHTWQMWRGAHE